MALSRSGTDLMDFFRTRASLLNWPKDPIVLKSGVISGLQAYKYPQGVACAAARAGLLTLDPLGKSFFLNLNYAQVGPSNVKYLNAYRHSRGFSWRWHIPCELLAFFAFFK